MIRALTLAFLVLGVPAVASEPEEPASADAGEPDAAAKAEYVRLSQDIAALAEKSHWEGVDRSYRKALATGVPLSFDDHMAGASAALALGDIAGARARFQAARVLHDDDPDVIESLWALDTAFAPVVVKATAGAVLSIATMPFQPDQARAVEYAAAQVLELGTFDGLLPAGSYEVAGKGFVVAIREIGAEPLVVDVTPEADSKKPRKRP